MRRTITSRLTAGALAAGMVTVLVGTIPGVAFATPSGTRTAGGARAAVVTTTTGITTAAGVATTPGATTTPGGGSGTAQPSHPACTPSVFAQAQQRVEADLAARVTQLNTLLSAVDNSANQLTSGDRQTLQTDINTVELPGIQALQPQAQQATTCAQLFKAAHAMVFNFRVYVVMTPQVHLTIVADDETSVEGQIVTLEPAIAQAIQNAQAQGKNVSGAQAAFTDLKNQVSAAQAATAGQASQVLAQTPAGFPGNWPVFLTARTDLVNAHTDLHAAYSDAKQIRADLK
jgi:hypothetical protein